MLCGVGLLQVSEREATVAGHGLARPVEASRRARVPAVILKPVVRQLVHETVQQGRCPLRVYPELTALCEVVVFLQPKPYV